MPMVVQFLSYSNDCMRAAADSTTQQQRSEFLAMARQWAELAKTEAKDTSDDLDPLHFSVVRYRGDR